MKTIVYLIAMLLIAASVAFADVPNPNRKPTPTPKQHRSIDADMDISLERDAKEARLIIPRSQIQQLRAALDEIDGGDDSAAVTATNTFGRTQTFVSGLFLSLAFVFGGVWLFRGGRASTRTGKTIVILVVAAGVVSTATFVFANAGPPPGASSITGKMFSEAVHTYNQGYGKVKLDVGKEGNRIKLIVPNPEDKKTDE